MSLVVIHILLLHATLCPESEVAFPADVATLRIAGLEMDHVDMKEAVEKLEDIKAEEAEKERRWFFLFGVVIAYPKLQSERILKEYFDPAMTFLAPAHRGTRTFTDFRNKGLLMPPQIAIGRILSDKFALSIHGGYSEGVRRTKRRDPSIFFGVPLSTNVSIRRYSTYLGLDLDYYPAGMVEAKKYTSLAERFRALKPTVGVRLNYNRTGYDARARVALGWFNRGVAVRLRDRWTLPGITLVGGVDIPITDRSVFVFNLGYTWFNKRTKDFDGPAITVAWRYLF
jgi:hypothetical protein